MTQVQIWKSSPFTIERKQGKAPGTVISRLCGPFTARDMYGSLTPSTCTTCSISNQRRASSCRPLASST